MGKREEKGAHLEINEAVIGRMKSEKIPMNEMGSAMLVLISLFEGTTELLDCADDSNKERRMHILYVQLMRRDLLEENKEGKIHWKLTPKGNEFATFLIEQRGKSEGTSVKVVQVAVAKEEVKGECGGWIDDYVNLFPHVNRGERPLRVHPDTCINKMNAFLKKYKYSEEVVLAATKAYIDDQTERGTYEYCSRADNFISKYAESHPDYASPLAAWCQRLIDQRSGAGPSDMISTSFMDIY